MRVTFRTSSLTIETVSNGKATLTITDVMGRVVLTKNLIDTEGSVSNQLNVASLANGLYMVVFETTAGRSVERFVKH